MTYKPSEPTEPSHPKRPQRLPGLFDWIEPFYLVSFNTHHRSPLLARHEVHTAFIDFCRKAERAHVLVGNYVLMPDHIHLLVVMPERDGRSLNSWIKALKSVLGKTLLSLGAEKPHWQEGYFDHVLRHNESHQNKQDYILQNPVCAGLCRKPEDWPYQGEIVVYRR